MLLHLQAVLGTQGQMQRHLCLSFIGWVLGIQAPSELTGHLTVSASFKPTPQPGDHGKG